MVLLLLLAAQGRWRETLAVRQCRGPFGWALATSTMALGLQLVALQFLPVGVVETVKRGVGNLAALILGRTILGETWSLHCLAAALAFMFSGAALANEDKPEKKSAAEAESAQPVGDTWITTKVKSSLLADDDVAGTKIEVDTVDGVVYLTGTAATAAQVEEARKIAAGIEGVSKVDTSKLVVSTN